MRSRLTTLTLLLTDWFYKQDIQATRILLGAMMSFYLRIGEPAWLLVVEHPGVEMGFMTYCGTADPSRSLWRVVIDRNVLHACDNFDVEAMWKRDGAGHGG